ncbi:MAG: 3-deoxy-D-manno-octulosonic acid kinase [Gammaproteobacteria bacterium]|nr:3-deoxy-D-manno-octulosonic acid kinase [Gammaproteobacteria bacterium]
MIGQSMIVYDDSVIEQMSEDLFDYASWPGAAEAPGYSGGRGATLFIEHQGDPWVLRHYHRGGKIGKFLKDEFLYLRAEKTRPLREYDLLDCMYRLSLPSPQPVAARYVRHGIYYTADLITRMLPDVKPLSNRLCEGPVDASVWSHVGECVGQFHAASIYHADLTAHNLQISTTGKVYLLDFDRGRRMEGLGSWQESNLMRLKRSFKKISEDQGIQFDRQHWDELLAGYQRVISQ